MNNFLIDKCTLVPLSERVFNQTELFTCGSDDDMDDFFRSDAISYNKFRMGNSYCFLLDDDRRKIVACFTISNDSLRIYDLPSSRKNVMWGITNREKMLSRFPGILIGRLAVSKDFARKGVGTQVLDFLKYWFSEEREKSACRFLIVDAKNEPEVLSFYKKNAFEFLFTSELQEDLYTKPPKDKNDESLRKANPRKLRTRLMYFDLINA